MRNRYGHSYQHTPDVSGTVFERLGGELTVLDPWTRIDAAWLDVSTRRQKDAVGYRGLSAAYRVAGLTLGDADAAPMCPPFIVEILADRVVAQVMWSVRDGGLASWHHTALQHWAAGSLSKDLRVLHFEDGDVGLEAMLPLGSTSSAAVLREFATAFSWDVAALHAADAGAELVTTEEWVSRAALSISRSTPSIPLRAHPSPTWHAYESPTGVFCSLQPGGGLAESDNVLYAVRREASALEPVVTMPGHRSDWDYARLIDVWLARDGAIAFARSLLCEGFVHTPGEGWRPVASDAISAVAPFGADGFLLGLHNGKVLILDRGDVPAVPIRIGRVTGRFSRLVTRGDRAIGISGDVVCSARVIRGANGRCTIAEAWTTRLVPPVGYDEVHELDVDGWSQQPAVAVLGDDVLVLVDAQTGTERARLDAVGARLVRWIGPGWLLVVESVTDGDETTARVRVLDGATVRWSAAYSVGEITRLAVRGDEIHVGYANQTVAVWDRLEVCRVVGAPATLLSSPEDHGTGAQAPVSESAAPRIATP